LDTFSRFSSNALHLNVADPNELFCPDKLWPAAEKGAR
jgi:hypothetical protein